MTSEIKKLPDVDSVRGVNVFGGIVEIQYQNAASDDWYSLSMTLPNAQFLLSALSDLPDADQIFQRARDFRRQNPIR